LGHTGDNVTTFNPKSGAFATYGNKICIAENSENYGSEGGQNRDCSFLAV
jgi:hypothetical protein